ncbi:MAG: hypothetical protein ABH869_08040 [Candidatus Omnitrophota bacterium]
MFIKKKNLVVIIFSSAVIAVVFLSTLIGYSLYLQWKKDAFALNYRNSIYRLTAELFRNNVNLSNINVDLRDNGLFSAMPILEGNIKNDTGKIITSILLEISFSEQDGSIIYRDWVYPMGGEHAEKYWAETPLFSARKQARTVLSPGEGITVRHLLRKCPPEVVALLSAKTNFAKSGTSHKIKFNYTIEGLSVL